jgi:hypothetical protein
MAHHADMYMELQPAMQLAVPLRAFITGGSRVALPGAFFCNEALNQGIADSSITTCWSDTCGRVAKHASSARKTVAPVSIPLDAVLGQAAVVRHGVDAGGTCGCQGTGQQGQHKEGSLQG